MGYAIGGICGMVLGIVACVIYDFFWRNKNLRHELHVAQAEREVASRKADEYFKLIEGIEKERNHAHSILDQANAEHGVAQDMMMREIQSVAVQYKKRAAQIIAALATNDLEGARAAAAEPLRASREVQQVAEQFQIHYGTPRQSPGKA